MEKMELGFIGLGRMGGNMVSRILQSKNVDVLVWNRSVEPIIEAEKQGATACKSTSDLIQKLTQKRKIVWLMLPSGDVTENTFREVLSLLGEGDIIIDGGNSNFQDTIRRHETAEKKVYQCLMLEFLVV